MSEHCFFCGHALDAEHTCTSCGIRRDALGDKRMRAPCPRCHDVRLVLFPLGFVALQTCTRCHGSFLSTADWDALFDEYASEPLPELELVADRDPYRAVRTSTEPERTNVTPDVLCPTCGEVMDRLEFAGISATIVDVCKLHGVWLDAGELDRVVDVVRKREQPVEHVEAHALEGVDLEAWVESLRKQGRESPVNLRRDPATVRLGRTLGAIMRWVRRRR